MNLEKNKQIVQNTSTSYDASQSLRDHGIFPTTQRLTIANRLLVKHQHMTAEQVYESIRSDQIKVSQATVYNTLGLFVKKGLLNEIFVDSSKTFYDTNIKPHQHFYNVDTGQLTDIKTPLAPALIQDDLPADTLIESINVVVRIKNHSS
ncbi:MAG: transcriptional repressor [Gammaproteobacteria bacterium]|nr:transcriptional repressor [Gammaproteobacteria bacterium]